MVRQEITIDAPPDEVFAVLLDVSAYADWVVGARRVRGADPEWPAVGARFHHALGIGPFELKDSSEILEIDPPHHLALEVRFRPFGVGRVDLHLEAVRGGRATLVTMDEVAGVNGTMSFIERLLIALRNWWSLRRLRRLAVQRAAQPAGGASRSAP
jgi:uncharacterized protein YndB with AHSA1/START domain